LKFCPLAEKRGSLEGVRERGFKGLWLRVFGFKVWNFRI
jgi:hypothetical protein